MQNNGAFPEKVGTGFSVRKRNKAKTKLCFDCIKT